MGFQKKWGLRKSNFGCSALGLIHFDGVLELPTQQPIREQAHWGSSLVVTLLLVHILFNEVNKFSEQEHDEQLRPTLTECRFEN